MTRQPITLANLLLGGEKPLVCAPSPELSSIFQWAKLQEQDRPDLFEWRQDLSMLNPIFPSVYRRIFHDLPPLPLPLILTRRRRQEGGAANDSQHRINLLVACAEIAAAVDIELDSPLRDRLVAALPSNKPLLVSWHNYESTPPLDELKARITRAAEVRSGQQTAIKFATYAHTPTDADTILVALTWARQQFPHPIIGIAMGAAGIATRTTPLTDLTFARAAAPSAPGQLSVAETRDALQKNALAPCARGLGEG